MLLGVYMAKENRTKSQRIKWWWQTKVLAFWRVRIGGASRRVQAKKAASSIVYNKLGVPLATPSDGITVILTAYKRAEYLVDQIKALKEQTVQPVEIWVWSNQSDKDLLDVSHLVDRVITSNTNWLFWGRFSIAGMVRTKYVAFFDDDNLPQPRWFENCLNTLKKSGNALLGGSGVILPTNGGYATKHKIGWNGYQLNEPEKVDLVGHSWFFDKSILQYMWREEPKSWDNGEDIHFAYMALKYGGIETLVPPHPESDMTLWSCRPDFGKRVGSLKVATYKTANHKDTRSMIVDAFRKDGWQLVSDRYPDRKFGLKS